MKIHRQICPACAAPLPATTGAVTCDHCGSELRIAADTGRLQPRTINNPNAVRTNAGMVAVKRPPMSKAKRNAIIGTVLVTVLLTLLTLYVGNNYNDHRIINGAAIAPDGSRFVSIHGQGLGRVGGTLRVWDSQTGKSLNVISGEGALLWQLAYSPDGRYVATGEHDGKIGIWDATNFQALRKLQGSTRFIDNLAWSPDSKRIAIGDAHGNLKVWDAESGTSIYSHPVHANNLETLAWSPDGKWIATGGWDNLTRIVEAATGKLVFEFKDTSYVDALAWSPDGRWLASGGLGKNVKIIDMETAKEMFNLSGHTNSVRGLMWLKDRKTVVSVGQDNSIRVWDATTGKHLQTLDNPGYNANARLSPDGRWLASGGRGEIRVWDVTDWSVRSWRGYSDENDIVVAGWSEDGKRLLTVGAYDEVMKVWDVEGGQELFDMQVTTGEAIRRVLF